MSQFNIDEFKPSAAQPDRIWLLIGGRNTGKTVLLRDLLYKTQRKTCDMCLAMTATISTANMFKKIMPTSFVYQNGYNYDVADAFLEACSANAEKGKIRHTVLVLDDVVFDNKILKNKTQQALHLNGRHFHTSIFETSQYSMLIPTVIRANIDYVFALKETVRANRRRLYENYFGVFASFAEFEKVFSEVTKNYGAIVLDRTQSSGMLKDLIKYYRSVDNTPDFKLGRPVFYKLHDIYNQKVEKKMNKKKSKSKSISIIP